MSLAHPFVQSALAPLLAALLAAALLRGRLQGACIGAGLLASLLLTRGLPWPARSGLDKLSWLVLAALLLGLALDAVGAGRRLRAGLSAVAVVAALLWLAAPQLAGAGVVLLLEVTALLGVGLLAVLRLPVAPAPAPVPAALLGVASLGIAGVAFNGGSLALAQAAAALAVAAAVHVAAGWIGASSAFGAAAALAGGGGWALLLGLVLLLTDASRWALAVLPLALLAELVSRRLPAGRGRASRVVASLWAALVAALPVAVAVWLSAAAGGGGDDLYYQ